ncbi:MAG: prepilin-type N-terminal cleavage/methylation domain-containing protein [Elusimicrobiaceae bacterium]|nr:prepilin-type N-terminal cleavage/methylation domain-containing protein [Elusimicrobiaceae bacterium]
MIQHKQAFTLIELLVVVLIIGILAAVAVPQYQKAVMKSRYAAIKSMVQSIAYAEETYYLANGTYTTQWTDLDIDTPTPTNEYPEGTGTARDFNWGSCHLWYDSVDCKVKDVLAFMIVHNHINFSYKYICTAYNTDLTSIENKICKEESGLSAPSDTGSYYTFWKYN